MKRKLHHRVRWLALGLVIATTIALAAQVRPDEEARPRLTLIPHAASAAPPPEPPAEPAPKAQAGQTIKVLSYNAFGAVRTPRIRRICSLVPPPGSGRMRCRPEKESGPLFDGVDGDQFRFVDVLAERIAAERPQLVGLQEMCGSQVNHLEQALASRAYPMVAYFDEHTKAKTETRCPTNDGRWPSLSLGKAVLTQGPATPEAPGDQVDVCVSWQGPIPIRFCSVHTGPDRIPTVARTLNGWVQTGAVIAVGDFNAEPDDPVMDSMYKGDDEDSRGRGSFYEADTSTARAFGFHHRYGGPTHGRLLREKIDYVFADAEHFEKPAAKPAPRGTAQSRQERTRAWVEDTAGQCGGEACSDHRMLWAEIFLRGGDFGALAGDWKDVSHAGGGGVATLTIRSDGSVQVFDNGCGCSTEPAQLHDLGMDPDWCQRGEPNCSPAVGPAYSTTVQWPAGNGMPSAPLMLRIQPYADAAGETVLAVNTDWYINHAFTRTGANPAQPSSVSPRCRRRLACPGRRCRRRPPPPMVNHPTSGPTTAKSIVPDGSSSLAAGRIEAGSLFAMSAPLPGSAAKPTRFCQSTAKDPGPRPDRRRPSDQRSAAGPCDD